MPSASARSSRVPATIIQYSIAPRYRDALCFGAVQSCCRCSACTRVLRRGPEMPSASARSNPVSVAVNSRLSRRGPEIPSASALSSRVSAGEHAQEPCRGPEMPSPSALSSRVSVGEHAQESCAEVQRCPLLRCSPAVLSLQNTQKRIAPRSRVVICFGAVQTRFRCRAI